MSELTATNCGCGCDDGCTTAVDVADAEMDAD